jgi:hypothetical protein
MLFFQSRGSKKDDHRELCEGVVLAHIKLHFSLDVGCITRRFSNF